MPRSLSLMARFLAVSTGAGAEAHPEQAADLPHDEDEEHDAILLLNLYINL
jgi:hypothetical protein